MSKFIYTLGLIGLALAVTGAAIHDLHGYFWAYGLMLSGLILVAVMSIYRDLHPCEHLLTCKEIFLGR